jgi:hypothetical protein
MTGAQDVDGTTAFQFGSRRREAARIRLAARGLSAAKPDGREQRDDG